jgi:hypothetical protein
VTDSSAYVNQSRYNTASGDATPMHSQTDTLAPGASRMSKVFARGSPSDAAYASTYNTISKNGPPILLTDNRIQASENSKKEYLKNRSMHKTEICPKDLITDSRVKEP